MRKLFFQAAFFLSLPWISFANNNGGSSCPDLSIVSLQITSISNTITYSYTIKNVGSDTLFINKIVVQNYTGPDSSFSGQLSAAGGSFIYPSTEKKYLLTDSILTLSTTAYPMVSIDLKPYLVAEFYLSGATECTSDKNIAIQKIVTNTSVPTTETPSEKIIWNPKNQSFHVSANNEGKYSVYNNLGQKVKTGIIKNSPKSLRLNPGIYIIDVITNRKKLTQRVIIE